MFTAKDIAALRKFTGAGMMDCKKALTECKGDMEESKKYLRKKGMAAVAKKAGRIAAEGVVGSYIHMGGKIGVMVEINCETDFVAISDKFQELVKNIAMHIAASNPTFITKEEVTTKDLEKEKEILRAQALNEGKPEAIVEKMIVGRMNKYYKDVCLMEQPYVKEPSKTITEIMNENTLIIGEKLSIRRFTRYEMGEGIEKRKENFAEEVMGQIK